MVANEVYHELVVSATLGKLYSALKSRITSKLILYQLNQKVL